MDTIQLSPEEISDRVVVLPGSFIRSKLSPDRFSKEVDKALREMGLEPFEGAARRYIEEIAYSTFCKEGEVKLPYPGSRDILIRYDSKEGKVIISSKGALVNIEA